jgi:hypothetical protein
MSSERMQVYTDHLSRALTLHVCDLVLLPLDQNAGELKGVKDAAGKCVAWLAPLLAD